jgi:hypothetical protein
MAREAFVTFGVDPTDADPFLVENSVFGAVTAAGSLNSIIDSTATLSRIRVSLGTDGAADVVADVAHTTAGGRSLVAPPPNVAVLVHKRSTLGGRRGRGRMFLPWATNESNIDEIGIILNTEVTTLQTAMGVFRGQLSSASCPMVILHDPGKTAAGPPTLVSSLTVDPLVGTQRRRLGR